MGRSSLADLAPLIFVDVRDVSPDHVSSLIPCIRPIRTLLFRWTKPFLSILIESGRFFFFLLGLEPAMVQPQGVPLFISAVCANLICPRCAESIESNLALPLA